ncbi:MAG: heterodisulfide reductase-related iron-sulfur binding cluster [Candidatus Aminicenantaceae bacterium]
MIKTIDIFIIFLSLGIFIWGIRRRTRLWFVGTPEDRSGLTKDRLKSLFADGIFHKRILQERYPGYLHLFIFVGFLLPLAVIIFTQVMFSLPGIPAQILSVLLDLVGLLAIISIVLFLFRRFVTRPSRLDNRPEDLVVLLLILAILLTGMLLESLKLNIIGREVSVWAPIGHVFSHLIQLSGIHIQTQSLLAKIVFRIHFFLVLGTIAYIPFSKMFHIISSPMNMFFRSFKIKGELSFIDLEDENRETFGVAKIEEFTWKQLMDLDACTRCGRCQDHCPAFLTEKPLSPKKFIQDLKNHMHTRAPQVLQSRADGKPGESQVELMDGGVIEKDSLWACTTCRSCMDHCPVYVEHIDKIIDMRRYQVLMASQFPEELVAAFKGLERNSNPWGLGHDTRADWIQELDIPIMAEYQGKDLDLLFFVGCIRSYDDRNKKVSIAMAKIMKHLGIKFAILGMEEGCCGDPARRVGNEYLYQILAQTNIETFRRHGVKEIITTCPHCFNTLKNEYPQLGFQAEVTHHTTFLEDQIRKGALTLNLPLNKKLTYHDPCYLGRYSGIYESPRDVLRSIPSLQLQEMQRTKKDSLCCGAGGGWMWMDEKIGKRINIRRLEDALKTNPEWIATACPFCVSMFDDAIKNTNRENELKIWDIAELAALSLFGDQDSGQ